MISLLLVLLAWVLLLFLTAAAAVAVKLNQRGGGCGGSPSSQELEIRARRVVIVCEHSRTRAKFSPFGIVPDDTFLDSAAGRKSAESFRFDAHRSSGCGCSSGNGTDGGKWNVSFAGAFI